MKSHRYNITRPRPRHGHKYTKYKMSLNIMMVISIKQHLSNIWSSIHGKVKQHWDWDEKSVAYKKACILEVCVEVHGDLFLPKQTPSYVFFKDYSNLLWLTSLRGNSEWLHLIFF